MIRNNCGNFQAVVTKKISLCTQALTLGVMQTHTPGGNTIALLIYKYVVKLKTI